MTEKHTYTIKKVEEKECAKVVAFMMDVRREVFPMIDYHSIPEDLEHVQEHYIDRDDAALFAAITEAGDVIGTIAYVRYDDRFHQLHALYAQVYTTELVRCYVDPNVRRHGVGTRLYQAVLQSIQVAGYEKIYLHTHPFLPGGVHFWRAQGFVERLNEVDSYWKTIHMDTSL